MNITRSSRQIGTALSLTTAVLLGSCAQTPPQPESSPNGGEPAALSGSVGPTGPARAKPSTPPAERPVAIRPDHPQTYTVKPGDTLWSIAGRFLQNPWQWRRIWRQNPQVRNPHRIYPGDVLRFSHDASGNPQLEIGERHEVPLIKLSPEVRAEALTQPIPPVPRDAVESFLTRGRVLGSADWRAMPYIVADDDDQAMFTARDRVYARGPSFDHSRYQVFRPGEELREPGSNRSLGVSGIYLGQATLERDGDPASFLLTQTIAPIYPGDRLLAIEEEGELYSFDPHPAPADVEGFIVSRLDPNVTQIAQYSSVVISLGTEDKIEPGHVLAIFGKDRQVADPVSGGTVKLPGEQAGLLMVYKAYEQVSYALVMQADRPIRLQDRVATP